VWGGEIIQIDRFAHAVPHLSFLDALAIENTRMIPEQALSTITNVDDIESYIQSAERVKKKLFASDRFARTRTS
jgi:hypothetical protein